MKIIKIEANKAEINLSENEIFALRQAFFVVRSNSSKIDDFEQTIGVSEQKSKELMDYFQGLRKRINPNSGATIVINRKICNLRSQKYDLCFYMQKIRPKIENVRLAITLQKKGTSETIVKTVWNTISIDQVRQELTLLKDKTNSSLHQTDTTSFSLFNEAIKLNISNIELKESDSEEKPQLNIEFIFPRGIQVSYLDSEDSPKTKKEVPFSNPLSFSSTVTPDRITNFIAKVKDFFNNKVNNQLE